jgi:hypothetical protein
MSLPSALGFARSARYEALDPSLKLAARQEHPAPTGLAAHAYLSAETHHFPGVSAARVGLARLHHIAEKQFNRCRHSINPP